MFGGTDIASPPLTPSAVHERTVMSDIEVNSTSEDGAATQSRVGDFELTVDGTEEEGPSPNQTLVADYASCYIAAFRVGAQQDGYDDLGEIDIDADADLDDDDDLEDIRFDMRIEEDVGDDLDDLISQGEDICHVHAALRDELHADISAEDGAI
jgi:organic hydroperoxide reductase OsmC/OhrA